MEKNYEAGERLSFYQLLLDKSYSVKIPIIQRDYAQGRDTAQEVRSVFIDSLYKYLDEDKTVNLDFVYGSIEGQNGSASLVPLDGQQRLTTLFLLHWYIANIEGRIGDLRKVLIKNDKVAFTYETRISSREFCKQLISNEIVIPALRDACLSEVIKDAPWFFLFWKNDPSIQSMLVMLDAIHEKFHDSSGFYEKLTNSQSPAITFQFIELESFKLSDALYIKMNARGKSLTDFENLKARLEQLLDQKDKLNGTNLKDDFSKKIDTEWTDLFWNYRDVQTHVFDQEFMNFIRVVVANDFALRKNDNRFVENLKLLIGREDAEDKNEKIKKVDYFKYDELGCFDDKTINNLMGILDHIKDGISKIKCFCPKTLIDENQMFENVLKNNLTYAERIQFYAWGRYLVFNKTSDGLQEWIRIIRNLSENTFYNEANQFANSVKSVEELLPFSKQIIKYIADESNQIQYFAGVQIQEERIKTILSQKNDSWKSLIKAVEDHKYFKGQIGFLLKFSGITDYYRGDKDLNWSEDQNEEYFEKFKSYSKKALAVFNESGLQTFNDFLWERALLVKGDYLLKKGVVRTFSFLIDSHRDISWKKLLRDDHEKRDLVKQLFDDVDITAINESLQNVINTSNVQDWRRYFIHYPTLIGNCGSNKFIRWENENDILLLEKSATNGKHREYYSFALAQLLAERGCTVEYQHQSKEGDEKFISKIDSHKLRISFVKDEGVWKYKFDLNGVISFYENENEVLSQLEQSKIIPAQKIDF